MMPFSSGSAASSAAVPVNHYFQRYRLDGSLAVTATPEVAARVAAAVGAVSGVPGNTCVIASGYRSISWSWLRATTLDSTVTINGDVYSAGSGAVYSTTGSASFEVPLGHIIDQALTVTVSSGAYVEIQVERVS
jgi:hypothetical protein